ncbi:hypothetical protein FQA39_LY02411 [Lamprigera yunnana]|nr:hypothetical protein FQA39_LY02411 [Lamprigera yunnana]
MQILGIKFVPLDTPIERRLQTFACGVAYLTIIFGGVLGSLTLLYLIFFTHYWLVAIIYLIWIGVVDKNTCDQGGRRIEWVRRWKWWKYVVDYFPLNLELASQFELDQKRNYLFCCFPHGIMPNGLFGAFNNYYGEFCNLFPNHTPHLLSLRTMFFWPFLRDLLLACGMCSVSAASLNYLLGTPEGGKVVGIIVGGAKEALYAKPGHYTVVLKNRKGFVKIALKNGAPLVPVYSFGETEIFNQINNPEGSLIRTIQDWIKSLTGVALAVPIGRGFFQYSFGLIPHRKPIYTIIGRPIELVKIPNPTQEQIDEIHKEFVKQLVALFEEHKHKYLSHPEKSWLNIL